MSNQAKADVKAVTEASYLSLASLLEGKESIQRVHKKEPHGEAVRRAGEMYQNREYVSAYECFKPVYDKVVSDKQRILARNLEFEANKLARELHKPLAAAKHNIQNLKAHAQQVIDQFDRLLEDLESKTLVRLHLKKGSSAGAAAAPPADEAPTTTLDSASEPQLYATTRSQTEVVIGERRYRKAPYSPPEKHFLYCVRDKTKGERIIRVIGKSPDGTRVQVETLENGMPSRQPIQFAVDSLVHQAAKGWCSLLLPVVDNAGSPAAARPPAAPDTTAAATLRLDIQNFGRCCADIVRAGIKFDTQLIKDVGDGPFRAGNYE